MEEENQKQHAITYKINENGFYKVSVKDWKNKKFYNIRLSQKGVDGNKWEFERPVVFLNCEPPENDDVIKIYNGFETNYRNPRDKYSTIMKIIITDYEKVRDIQEIENDALSEYREKISNSDVIDEDDLPF